MQAILNSLIHLLVDDNLGNKPANKITNSYFKVDEKEQEYDEPQPLDRLLHLLLRINEVDFLLIYRITVRGMLTSTTIMKL